MNRILVTGATGQIGSELTLILREKYGKEKVIATGRKTRPGDKLLDGPFNFLDCTDKKSLEKLVKEENIDTIYHLAAILSAAAEENPPQAWDININGLYNVLEVAREREGAVFVPSSIGAFGPGTPLDGTPQETVQRPNTMYGVTKVAGELLCDYYHTRYGVDTRGLRYPGIISYITQPGGGTTDYAVEIFYEALKQGSYTCPLRPDTMLDMMYIPDALKAAVDLMEVPPDKLKHRNAFNVTAMSFTPETIAGEIRKHLPGFKIEYQVDPVKQAIADTWPNYMDDTAAREEWGWAPEYDMEAVVKDMLEKIEQKLKEMGEL